MIDTSGLALPKPNHVPGQKRITKAAMQRERKRRWEAGERTCHICQGLILDYSNFCLDHFKPGKMGGCKNDHPDNLLPAHIFPCNTKKGSKRY